MDCEEARSRLIDAADGALEADVAAHLEQHLASCPECRSEADALRTAAAALRTAAAEIAPRRTYLTPDRLARLMVAYGRDSKVIRLHLHRGLVASVAVAAIVVSAVVIALSMPDMFTAPEQAPMMASQPPAPSAVPVVFTASGGGEPMRMIRPVTAESQGEADWRPPTGALYVGTNGPGVIVPAEHAFYDPEESSRWW